jgi:DNA-binding IclR family transcriptional regulator
MTIAIYPYAPDKRAQPHTQPAKQLIGSVQRALAILELLAAHPAGLSAKQVALKTQLNLSTCYHLLNTLEYEGYAIKDPDTLLFRLSGKIGYTELGQISPAQLVQQLTPHVKLLQELSRETSYLSVWDGQEITLSAIVEAPQTVQVKSLTIGETEANHASALGKAILAWFTDDAFDRYFARRRLPAFTANTITSPETLRATLPQVQQQGFALDCEEFMPDVHCIGAPIFDARGDITGSIAISLPVSRVNGNQSRLIEQVTHVAAVASRALQILGYAGPASRPEAE